MKNNLETRSSKAMEAGVSYDVGNGAAYYDSAFTSWNTLSSDTAHALLSGRHSYTSSSSSLRSTCTRPDGMIIKAKYGTNIIQFGLPLASSLVDLEENVTERLHELKYGTFRIKYKDDEGDWILITNDDDLQFCMASLRSVGHNTILMLIEEMQHLQRNWKQINPLTLLDFAIFLAFVLDLCIDLYSSPSIFSSICHLSLHFGVAFGHFSLFMLKGFLLRKKLPKKCPKMSSQCDSRILDHISRFNGRTIVLSFAIFCHYPINFLATQGRSITPTVYFSMKRLVARKLTLVSVLLTPHSIISRS